MFQSKLPADSKAWVYQSQRKFTQEEEREIQIRLEEFLSDWDSHGAIIKSEGVVEYHQFIIVVADNTQEALCGSAADRLFRFIQVLEKEYQLSLTDRMQVAYKKEETIEVVNVNTFKELLRKEEVNENTIVFNNIITTNTELKEKWEVPVKESWHKQLLALTI